jgi:mRNA interferase HigB
MSIRNLRVDAARYPDVIEPVEAWYRVVKYASWQNLEDVRQVYSSADAGGNFTVFNIKGNEYRLIVDIDYQTQTICYKYLLTHADYNKDKWKNNPYF